ncbi:MAG: alpha/beta hydrolase, partial [Phycisphaerae bacterium]|nr:alpha/beta hydrolase [Phycisphaerae bacterium]
MQRRTLAPFAGIMAALLLIPGTGCKSRTYLIATPTLCQADAIRQMWQAFPEDSRTVELDLLYAADRDVVKRSELTGVQYGSGRSGHLAIGSAVVSFQPEVTWDQLTEFSTQARRRGRLALTLKSATEFGVLAVPLDEMVVADGRYVLPPKQTALLAEGKQKLHQELARRLARTPYKDVYLYVHGFNNTFEDAVFRLAMVWQMAGRPGAPIAYTWPAGRGGLTGYAYDRESGEFTVYHLRKFIEALVESPDVQRLHIIAHSRGTDVVCTALRELNLQHKKPDDRSFVQRKLKLENLVLAAPDLSPDVFEQRVAIE